MSFRKITAFALALASVALVFSSCGGNEEIQETTTGYQYIPSGQEGTTADNSPAANESLKIDTSWQKNFKAEYEYYNPEQSISTMSIREKKSTNAFTVEYIDTNSVLYYKANGSDTDYYVLMNGEEQQVHSVLEGKHFSTLSSMFMKLSQVKSDLPKQSNVLYMYDEEVAGRPCHKYIQRAYSGGKLTESVYVWIDAQYGFAAKCEAYDENNILTVMWKLTSFETGTLKDDDVYVDLTQYTFGEIVG